MNITKKYISETKLEHRKKYGQYFTPQSLIDIALSASLDRMPELKSPIVLEPSCGTGDFIQSILDFRPCAIVDAIEKDEKVFKLCEERFSNQGKYVNIQNTDTLLLDINRKYDFVVGNPPYFETTNERYKKLFSEIVGGRPNIYSYFIKYSIDCVKDGGFVSLVVPTSMLNGAYFSKLRDYIVKNCSIVDIITDYKDDYFEDAQQNVMVLVLKKEENDGKFIFKKNGIMFFSKQYKELEKMYKNSKSLKELGFSVKTGTVVWNQNKDKLTDSKNSTLLVWAHNINDGRFELSNKKPQYIRGIKDKEKTPIIAVNRITGMGKNISLRACIVDHPNGAVCENHVNVISKTEYSSNTIEDILEQIKNPEAINVLKNITGNTQISKTELENLFPLWI